MHKYDVGRSNPTSNRAISMMVAEQASLWVKKIDAHTDVAGVSIVLRDMVAGVRRGEVTMEVFEEVLKRRTVRASINALLQEGV